MTLINWDNAKPPGLHVNVRVARKPKSVRSVQSQKDLTGWTFQDGKVSFKTDLVWADYILIEK